MHFNRHAFVGKYVNITLLIISSEQTREEQFLHPIRSSLGLLVYVNLCTMSIYLLSYVL